MLLQADDCQLVLIDYQARLMPAMHGSEAVLANAHRLAELATALDIPVWGTAQIPDKLGVLDPALARYCRQVVDKSSFSAAEVLQPLLAPAAPAPRGNARSLPRHLQKKAAADEPERGALVLAGCETHVCLLQTALGLLELDWDVWVVTDACSSRTERNRDAAYDRLAAAGCELVTTEMVGFEWLADADHPSFRAWQKLIR